MPDEICWKWSLLIGLSSLWPPIFTIFTDVEELWWYKIWMEEWLEAKSSYFYFRFESLIEFDVRPIKLCWLYWDIKVRIWIVIILNLNYWLIIPLLFYDSIIRCLTYLWGEFSISMQRFPWPSAHDLGSGAWQCARMSFESWIRY